MKARPSSGRRRFARTITGPWPSRERLEFVPDQTWDAANMGRGWRVNWLGHSCCRFGETSETFNVLANGQAVVVGNRQTAALEIDLEFRAQGNPLGPEA